MLTEFEKWPIIYQLIAGLGAFAAGVTAYFWGKKAPPSTLPPMDSMAVAEVRTLALEIKALRGDMGIAIEALKTSVNDQIEEMQKQSRIQWHDFDERLRQDERDVAVLLDRHSRGPRR